MLSDAAFLGWYVSLHLHMHFLRTEGAISLAANYAGLPSVLITNFSFDSVYSYLSTSLIDAIPIPSPNEIEPLQAQKGPDLPPDIPIPLEELAPLVNQIISGFRCADLLLRLPGAIPIPSFSINPTLPSPDWVDPITRTFIPEVVAHLKAPVSVHTLYPSIPFPSPYGPKPLSRTMLSAPLLVRSPNPAVYTFEGRARLLKSIGVPPQLHDPETTKILIVSFGGQVFHRPQSRIHSRSASAAATPGPFAAATTKSLNGKVREMPFAKPSDSSKGYFPDPDTLSVALRTVSIGTRDYTNAPSPGLAPPPVLTRPRAMSLLTIPGAPPIVLPASPPAGSMKSPPSIARPTFETITTPPSPKPGTDPDASRYASPAVESVTEADAMDEYIPRLLPGETWIAIVCGVSKEWGTENGEELPDNFFVAPRDVYMPDLTAVADVLLGKLVSVVYSPCLWSC